MLLSCFRKRMSGLIEGRLGVTRDPQTVDGAAILGNLDPLDVVEYGCKRERKKLK